MRWGLWLPASMGYALRLDPTPCEVGKAGPRRGALDMVPFSTSEEHSASNLISLRAILDSKVGSARVWAGGVCWIYTSGLDATPYPIGLAGSPGGSH